MIEVAPLTIETPASQWAYAVDFEFTREEGVAVDVAVDVEVTSGEAAVGLLTADESADHVERLIAVDDGRTTLVLRLAADQQSQRLVLRNVGASGCPAMAVIRGIDVRRASSDQSLTPEEPVINISSRLLHRFQLFSGRVPAGFSVNWIGVITRAHVYPLPPDAQAIFGRERYENHGYPLDNEHVLDWVPLLEAVESSGPLFRMVALGAGWGRWLTAGAFAAAQTGRTVQLTGVEAEPDHFVWMEEHMRDNGIPAADVRLIHAAASSSHEPCWFPVESPGWYGQSIVLDAQATEQGDAADRTVNGIRLQRIEAVTVEDVVPADHVVDYLHMDIQGTEYDFLARDPGRLASLVRTVNVGTHSEIIERRLRRLFHSLGWINKYDVTLGASVEVRMDGEPAAVVAFGDGVQVWTNPALF